MHHRFPAQGRAGRPSAGAEGFTLMELLLVLVIIGILTGVALPSMKGLQKSNLMANATRQLVDDLARARATAIRERTTVYVVFVPTNIVDLFNRLPANPGADPGAVLDRKQWTNLLSGVYTRYALYAERTVGDQPGQARPRYLTDWQQLPEGVTIASWEFDPPRSGPLEDQPLPYERLRFPTVNGLDDIEVPALAFDSSGALLSDDGVGNRLLRDEVISLARASVLVVRNLDGLVEELDYRESPPNNSRDNYNRIRIDALTGRARVEQKPLE